MGDEHFEKELNAELPSEPPWKCPKCPADAAYTGNDLRSLRVHYGTRHKAVMVIFILIHFRTSNLTLILSTPIESEKNPGCKHRHRDSVY